MKLKFPKSGLPMAAAGGVFIAAAASGGTVLALSATAPATPAPPGALYGCVRYSDRALIGAYTVKSNFPGCPSGSFAATVASIPGTNGTDGTSPAVTAVAAGSTCANAGVAITDPASGKTYDVCNGTDGTNGTNGTSYTPVTATAVTAITGDQDSSANGNWAVDTLTRTMTVTRHGQVAVSDCGGTGTNGITSCYYYTATMTDGGSFTTIKGAKSPNAGTAINGVLGGSINGGSEYEFYATSGAPDGTKVPATLDASVSGTGSSQWPERFFPAGTQFGGMNEINWTYVYTTPNTCEKWTDAYNNGGGAQVGDGDITGVNAC